MIIDPNDVSIGAVYESMVALITPRPIAWVSTLSADGVANLAPYSFFGGVGANPPTVMFCPVNRLDGTPKDTLANVRANGQFVVNVVTEEFAETMKQSATDVRPDEDEFVLTGLQKAPSVKVKVPRVADVVAAMECEMLTSMQLGPGRGGANLVVGRIVSFYVADSVVGKNGLPDPEQIFTIGRMGGPRYTRTRDRFE
ncbi:MULTISPECIES: flavin reductase family protein [Rhodopirellula]|jgi:flavin reductase (DIM6/NTAB) family NADH-FMN oxidoreductase RutF|uniref:Flavin reductase domain protein FMN-binding protein n=1 Tax=Rhodopirellula europaea 6C TaxID=1263867 RepID=M2ASG0_9BACT|nr:MULTISPECIES: flavin reductase family protein [Rhodopirellula]EMB15652.1 flavin reductase domain protein FMN-binding protein [Rhodopirellula europaea 6C]|tara:strand:+ start:15490 stop:16083 length:594 start_codon:yes stop_codon:yes gene_type:complete